LDVVLGTNQLTSINGAETYLTTVADQLQRFGHRVTVFGLELGQMAEFAAGRGLRVTDREAELPESCDAVLVNDAVSALTLAEHYGTTPQVFVAHGEGYLFCTPPQLPEVTSAVVALNDRVARRMQALALVPEVVRLRQPIDLDRFTDRGAPRPRARRVLLLGNYLRGERRQLVTDACAELGLEWTQVGAHGAPTPEPELAIAEADIVIGHGRAILEAMASGRAAYAYDHSGADGWVTPAGYPAMESDGFAGHRLAPEIPDRERLRRDLEGYQADMGRQNRDLAERYHRAGLHAEQLVALFERLAPRRTPAADPLAEMVRLTALERRAVGRAELSRTENRILRAQVHELESQVAELKNTRRYRTMERLLWPLELLRRIRPSSRRRPRSGS
jgi:hypothetical protein